VQEVDTLNQYITIAQCRSLFSGTGSGQVAAWAGVIGAGVGAIASILPNWILERVRESHEEKSVRAGLLAEIAGILATVQAREYSRTLEHCIERLKANPGSTLSMMSCIEKTGPS